jgi:hypothetical protein
LLFLVFPRGLITAVLALQVLAARGQTFFYLPGMAFTVVLFTNIFVVLASVRAKRRKPSEALAQAPPAILAAAVETEPTL